VDVGLASLICQQLAFKKMNDWDEKKSHCLSTPQDATKATWQ
jgi:hypothetical protein